VLKNYKYKNVNLILILNMIMIGMNGNFAITMGIKNMIKSITHFYGVNLNYDASAVLLIFVATFESMKMIGIALGSKLLRNEKTNRKMAIKKYALYMAVLNGILLILFLLDRITYTAFFFWLMIIGGFLIMIINDSFNNSFNIMYNLEVTIGPSYSLIVLLKNFGEFSYSFVFMPLGLVAIDFGMGSLITF
jgi:hypothetical protein